MIDVQHPVPVDGRTQELLAQLALALLKGNPLPSLRAPESVESVESAAADVSGTSLGQLTVRADQVKVIGAGRRPASLVGRQVTVTLVATVIAEHENGTLAVTVAEADRTARRPRAKRPAKVSRRSKSTGHGRSAKKRPSARRAATNQAKDGNS